MKPLNLVILISGRGSNMSALIEACKDDTFPATISAVFSNKPDAQGLKIAADQEIHAAAINHKDFASRSDFETALHEHIAAHNPDIICLAGFMRILSAEFIAKWPNKIINIHPSLLPDYKGLNTHERAIADGKDQSGCTVHYVVPEMDSGEIIIQKSVSILANDTPESLAQRILVQEHLAYPEAIKKIAHSLTSGA